MKNYEHTAENWTNLLPLESILALSTKSQKFANLVLHQFIFDNFQSEHPVQNCYRKGLFRIRALYHFYYLLGIPISKYKRTVHHIIFPWEDLTNCIGNTFMFWQKNCPILPHFYTRKVWEKLKCTLWLPSLTSCNSWHLTVLNLSFDVHMSSVANFEFDQKRIDIYETFQKNNLDNFQVVILI